MDDSLYSECEKFIKDNRRRYERLLDEVLRLAKHLRDVDNAERIYRVYSRGENRDEEDEFKKTYKVAEKLGKWRENYNPKSRVEEIHDIIGVTVVVHYDSDIAAVYDMIRGSHQAHNLKIVP